MINNLFKWWKYKKNKQTKTRYFQNFELHLMCLFFIFENLIIYYLNSESD